MNNRTLFALASSALLAGAFVGCHSDILPMRPLQRTTTWVPDTTPAPLPDASQSATVPATQTAATTHPTTRPGKNVVTVTDSNQISRFIYQADYDNIWRQSMATLAKAGFLLDRLDYRLGVITTKPLPSAQLGEFWKTQQSTPKNALENTINNQQHHVRLTIAPVPNKPDFYEISIQVIVERQTNPAEQIGGPVFVQGSGFGRSNVTLRSDYAAATKTDDPAIWVIVGHDPDLEKKLMNALFHRI